MTARLTGQRRCFGFWLAGLLILGGCANAPLGDPAKDVAAATIPIVKLQGSPSEIGLAHGWRLGEPIRLLRQQYLRTWFRTEQAYNQALAEATAFGPHLLAEHRAEIEALGDASGLGKADAMLANCFLDLSPTASCSTVALASEASADGVGRLGRTLDFPSLGVADRFSVVLVVRPAGRHAFVAISWPGLIGVLSGMNEHGLCLANMEVPRQRRPADGMPYTLLYRRILEECATVEQAIALLEKAARQSANNLILMDAAGSRAVAEIRPESVSVRVGLPGKALISTNHQRGQDQDREGLCPRYDLLKCLCQEQYGRIDQQTMQGMLRAVGGAGTMQAMVMEPTNRVIYLAAGTSAATRPYQRLDVGQLLGG